MTQTRIIDFLILNSVCVPAGLVPKPTSQVPEAGATSAAEGESGFVWRQRGDFDARQRPRRAPQPELHAWRQKRTQTQRQPQARQWNPIPAVARHQAPQQRLR